MGKDHKFMGTCNLTFLSREEFLSGVSNVQTSTGFRFACEYTLCHHKIAGFSCMHLKLFFLFSCSDNNFMKFMKKIPHGFYEEQNTLNALILYVLLLYQYEAKLFHKKQCTNLEFAVWN